MYRLLVILTTVALSSCGSGGEVDNQPEDTNTAGYPDVAGRYSFNTSDFDVSCFDGSTGTNPPIALDLVIYQTGNAIRMEPFVFSSSDIRAMDSTDPQGHVQKDSTFNVNLYITNDSDSLGTYTINYTWTGNFTSNGWNGSYRYSMGIGLDSCTFTSTFTGDKVGSKQITQSSETAYFFEYPADIYDSYSLLAKVPAL